ncbi:unnamed protein product [Peniophora sp. CBMAI 1063]|nr:unnamed protein product [Peniophora sp. CBMAI 1063]
MLGAVDPTYPLYPLACILASMGVLAVLITSFVRQSWNRGVAFLCFWLFLENVAGAIDTIIWSDNATIKLFVYCDIVSHLGAFIHIVKPMSTFIIMRRLYLITSLLPDALLGTTTERWNLMVDWTLGLLFPALLAGPVYYVFQGSRFAIQEGFGCTQAISGTVPYYLSVESWTIIPPLFSVIMYYPQVLRTFYLHRRDISQFVHTNVSTDRTSYVRILALASLDVILTLPFGVVTIVLGVIAGVRNSAYNNYPLYTGWATVHNNWEPVSWSYAYWKSEAGPFNIAHAYFSYWTSPILAFAIFGLFGLTTEARASYSAITLPIWRALLWSRRTGADISNAAPPAIRFAERSLADLEMGIYDDTIVPTPTHMPAGGRESTGGTKIQTTSEECGKSGVGDSEGEWYVKGKKLNGGESTGDGSGHLASDSESQTIQVQSSWKTGE